MTATSPQEGLIQLPVPEGSLANIQGITRQAIRDEALDSYPLGVEQEYPVYRAAAQGVLGVLMKQNVAFATDLSDKLIDTAHATNGVVDIFTVAANEEHRADFKHRAEGVYMPTDDERLVALAHAVGTTAHAIAAVELGHESAPDNIERAAKELDKPGVGTDIGSIPDYTLHVLLDELRSQVDNTDQLKAA